MENFTIKLKNSNSYKDFYYNTNISMQAKSVIAMIQEFPSKGIKFGYLCMCCKEKDEEVYKILKELERFNYVVITK